MWVSVREKILETYFTHPPIMTCHLIISDFKPGVLGLQDPITGICLTPNCPYRHVGLHPRNPTETTKTFELPPVRPGSAVLKEYVDTGNRLKNSASSGICMIESGLTDFINAVQSSATDSTSAAMFAYLDGSSGLGKTQLAFSVRRSVLYIPQGESQEIYRCFEGLRLAVAQAIILDQEALRAANNKFEFDTTSEFTAGYIKSAIGENGVFQFYTVHLLVKLLELFSSPSSRAATYGTNVFLGPVEALSVKLEGMTLQEGRIAARQYRGTLIHIDEVPMHDPLAADPFLRCLLLRNIIRCMGLPCLLSGTESTLLDVVEFGRGSRREGSEPWAWLLTRFPATELSEQLTALTRRCRGYEQQLLLTTRPLFVQWFARCFENGLTGTDAEGQICVTPTTLTAMKKEMCMAKQLLPEGAAIATVKGDIELSWLHASTLLVFADSLQGSGKVTNTVSAAVTEPVGTKRPAPEPPALPQVQRVADDVHHHTLLIRKHFALLYLPPSLVIKNCVAPLHIDLKIGVCDSCGKPFTARAAFKNCVEDPLLYLAGLRDGVMHRSDPVHVVPVPSSYAFTTFRQQSGVGNRLAKSNDGTGLEAECVAALVLAAHRYDTFHGTPFFSWLALVVAELNYVQDFEMTKITKIPTELATALQGVMVPLLSPPNSPWGDSMGTDINFGNFSWCKNQERRDASVPLRNTKPAGLQVEGEGEAEGQGEGQVEGADEESDVALFPLVAGTHGYTSLGAEFKDVGGFGGKKMTAVTTKVAKNSVSLLIGRDLSDWKAETVQQFPTDVSVYRMNAKGSIVRVSPQVTHWEAGRKVLIALDLKQLYPGRSAALPHAT